MSERDVLGRGACKLEPGGLALAVTVARRLAHAREAERVEDVRVGEVFVVEVDRMRGRAEDGALGDEHAVVEDDVLHSDSHQGRCSVYRAFSRLAYSIEESRKRLTEGEAVVALRLAEDTVEFPHPDEGCRCPAFLFDDHLDLLAEREDKVGALCELEEHLGHALANGEERQLLCKELNKVEARTLEEVCMAARFSRSSLSVISESVSCLATALSMIHWRTSFWDEVPFK